MDGEIQAAFACSFRGQLYLRAVDWNIPLRLSRWGVTPEDDWLQAGGKQQSPMMNFQYDSHTEDRLHYHISIPGNPKRKKLGVSRNGYLGFYWNAEITDYWKIEPLQLTDEGLVCNLRDHRGHRVGVIKDDPHKSGDWVALLNVDEGEVFTFLLKPVG